MYSNVFTIAMQTTMLSDYHAQKNGP